MHGCGSFLYSRYFKRHGCTIIIILLLTVSNELEQILMVLEFSRINNIISENCQTAKLKPPPMFIYIII